jgi:hypothetical protein
MSLEYCHKHDVMFDTDVKEHCPVCECECKYAILLTEDQLLSRDDQTPCVFDTIKEAHFFAAKHPGANVIEVYDE